MGYSYEPRLHHALQLRLIGTGYIALTAAPESQMPPRIFLNARDWMSRFDENSEMGTGVQGINP